MYYNCIRTARIWGSKNVHMILNQNIEIMGVLSLWSSCWAIWKLLVDSFFVVCSLFGVAMVDRDGPVDWCSLLRDVDNGLWSSNRLGICPMFVGLFVATCKHKTNNTSQRCVERLYNSLKFGPVKSGQFFLNDIRKGQLEATKYCQTYGQAFLGRIVVGGGVGSNEKGKWYISKAEYSLRLGPF